MRDFVVRGAGVTWRYLSKKAHIEQELIRTREINTTEHASRQKDLTRSRENRFIEEELIRMSEINPTKPVLRQKDLTSTKSSDLASQSQPLMVSKVLVGLTGHLIVRKRFERNKSKSKIREIRPPKLNIP